MFKKMADGENINKLEKADILELTVRHLKRISRLHDPIQEAHRFQAGFSQCANEVCTFLVSLPGLNTALGSRLLEHLKQCISKHRTPYPMVPSAADHQTHVSSPKPLQVSVVSSQRFSPPLSPSPASSIESPVRPIMPSQKQFLPYKKDVMLHSSPPSPPALPEDLSTQESNSMWRPW
ncbi:hypothetical protein V9T40_011502 [Parthenolecanium corni]|uniref:Orange domain-containing protein n=1 Tax=Parthenolecanium corni TaxID=536013 RepID=A0AAN9T781_9HEMI